MKINFNKDKFTSKMLQNQQATLAKMYPGGDIPDSFFRTLMDEQLSKGYLNNLGNPEDWEYDEPSMLANTYGWLQFERLPITPGKEEENTLLESWQSVLSACHTMNLSIAFVLLRTTESANIYLGARTQNGETEKAKEMLLQCMSIHMPGAKFEPRTGVYAAPAISKLSNTGVVMGIPSLRSENSGVTLQTLDKLAKGININKKEKEYAMMVIADPAKDSEIVELEQNFLELKSEIHSLIGYTTSDSYFQGQNTNTGVTASVDLGMITEALALGSFFMGNVAGAAGLMAFSSTQLSANKTWGRNFGSSSGVSREYRNFVGSYCEDLIDKNISRFEQGRNLGFWKTGVYVLAEDDVTTDSVLGMLRSVYSGSSTYIEPIRVFNTSSRSDSIISTYIKSYNFLPLPGKNETKKELAKEFDQKKEHWHIFGRMYESFATAMTTEELSIASSLPRREVSGLRMVKNGASFANNTIATDKDTKKITMGKLVDMGVEQNIPYDIIADALIRHILVCGITGSGKSTTSKKIIEGMLKNNIPVMIIEPAKDDYVRWAIEQNKNLPEDKQFRIFMPGVNEIDGVTPEPFLLNMFEPAKWENSPVNFIQHAENISTLINSCLPGEDVIPVIIEEAIHECIEYWGDENAQKAAGVDVYEISPVNKNVAYPTLFDLKNAGNRVIDRKTYENRTKENFREILNTRFQFLLRGTRGRILNCVKSSDFETLFNRPVIINLSKLAGTKDKSLIMSLILLALQEYRTSRYENDAEYRAEAQKNKLQHLMVIEEAHNVLTKPSPMSIGSGNPQQASADLFSNMLSEIRAYGQGLMLIDQTPTKLIDDALKNTNYKIAHRLVSPDDVEVMAKAMALRPEQSDVIHSLETGNTIICGDMDDSAAWVKIDNSKQS